ncbi:MAG: hypothetical protein AMXMBFR84_25860 [Candidatus Hydrogenedentota bacterium]
MDKQHGRSAQKRKDARPRRPTEDAGFQLQTGLGKIGNRLRQTGQGDPAEWAEILARAEAYNNYVVLQGVRGSVAPFIKDKQLNDQVRNADKPPRMEQDREDQEKRKAPKLKAAAP